MPLSDQRPGLVIGPLRRIAEAVGRVAVHHHLARRHAQATRLGGLEERLGALRMRGAIDAGGGDPVGEREVQVKLRLGAGVGGVAETQLLREGVEVQPVDQPLAPTGDHRCLRIVQMRIDEPRQDKAIAVVCDLCSGMRRRQIGSMPDLGDHALTNQNTPARLVAYSRNSISERVSRIYQRLTYQQCCVRHGYALSLRMPV